MSGHSRKLTSKTKGPRIFQRGEFYMIDETHRFPVENEVTPEERFPNSILPRRVSYLNFPEPWPEANLRDFSNPALGVPFICEEPKLKG